MSARSLAAAFIGTLAGLGVFLLLVALGVVLYQRLFAGSSPLLALLVVMGGAIGAYSGWLLGLIVFSALRGADEGAPPDESEAENEAEAG